MLGVAAGAFGAHALHGRLESGQLQAFETAVRYQLIHALALLVVGLARGNCGGWLALALGMARRDPGDPA